MYILIAIFHINGGSFSITQEFYSEPNCQTAKKWLWKEDARLHLQLKTVECFPKGVDI